MQCGGRFADEACWSLTPEVYDLHAGTSLVVPQGNEDTELLKGPREVNAVLGWLGYPSYIRAAFTCSTCWRLAAHKRFDHLASPVLSLSGKESESLPEQVSWPRPDGSRRRCAWAGFLPPPSGVSIAAVRVFRDARGGSEG